MGKADTSDLMMIITWVTNTSFQLHKLEWDSWTHITSNIAKKVKAPLHRAGTFAPPLSNQKNDQDAQWPPKSRKFCFCVIAAARTPCLYWATKTAVMAKQVTQRRQNYCHGGSRVAVVAEWRHSGRHIDRSMDTIGRLKEAQWWYKGGSSITQIDAQCLKQYTLLTGLLMTDSCASILRSWRHVCLPHASFERHVSDWLPRT